ncbi:homocysteine S-methyltransferase family protein [uncultured Dialister sp.]|jgi:5-methyltetrahydrofolate--homocysteine methyltransferase|uniref:homocysteine S-methyltransferase family protein n=1 Tax=uncultured Dialister sp. TaxID=278064 RepID=UPI0025F2E5F5|nr:homocysteine S-methyltransferase family protein [uncultured Dialister sp.]
MILFDGGMGTMLQKFGLETGSCPDYYNISHPEVVQQIHRAYMEAGSQYITTNTFGSSPLKLSDYDLQDQVEKIASAAVANVRKACGDRVKVAGDMGPTGKFIRPIGDLSFDEACENYYRLAKALADAGADCLIIETIIDIQEMKAALLAAKTASSLPVICQMSYGEDGRTIPGTDPITATILLDAMGADVIGANCSVGPDRLLDAAKQMVSVTNKPVIIQPNAGMPVLENGETHFPLDPEAFASYGPAYAEAGISFMGGCCGTTPDHIRALKEALDKAPQVTPNPVKPFTALTSRTKTVFIGDDYAPVKIGERINPTGRRKMREDIQRGSFVSVKKEGLAEVAAGADVLDVNMGVPGIDQREAMETAISQLSMLCPVPLSIDSTDPEVLERALKVYPGRPLINSVNGADDTVLEKVLSLAKKYGAAVLCLPLEKGNLPETAEERIRIARRIIEKALAMGLRKEDLLLDPLVLTIGSSDTGARETLKTIALYKKEFGLPCVMGTSNVSFGLPARPRINAAFLTMAFACGMNAPIINPLDQDMKDAFVNAKLLLGFDPGAQNFIREAAAVAAPASKETAKDLPPLEAIKAAVKNGEKEEAASLMKKALDSGISSEAIIKEGLTAAMTEIGDGYGAGKVYLPQVMMAAEAMQAAFKELKKLLPDVQAAAKGTLVIGTVKGDIHDLGKNIVSALMENSGYHVVDLGKDVEPADFIKAAKENKADLVGLCSLMTTTLPELEHTVQALKAESPAADILVGGAVVTQDYATRIGAPNYCKDGIAAVRIADALIEKRNG